MPPSPLWILYRRAVHLALKDSLDSHDVAILSDLIMMTGQARIWEAVPDLMNFLEHDRTEGIWDRAVAVLAGFYEDRRVQNVFEDYLFQSDDPLLKRYSAHYLNVLCRAHPERYPRYLNRFTKNMHEMNGEETFDFVMGRLFREILPREVIDDAHFSELDEETQRIVVSLGLR